MPELPDVEDQRRTFARHAAGQRVRRVAVPAPDILRDTSPQGLGRALGGRRFDQPQRHGKWLLAPTNDGDGPTLVLHFGMTGSLSWTDEPDDEPRHRHDQRLVAGLGNLLVDEILWLARLHPRRGAADLDPGELARLHDAMREVLATSVQHGNVPGLDDWLTGARDDPEPACPRHGEPLERATVAGRTTRWCSRCQPEPDEG